MLRSVLVLGVCCCATAPALFAQEPAAASPQPAPLLRSVHITGNKEIAEPAVREALRVRPGQPLADSPERVAGRVESQYHDEGYTFARVKPTSTLPLARSP